LCFRKSLAHSRKTQLPKGSLGTADRGPSSLDNRRCRARHLHQVPFPTVPQSSRQARTERLKLAQRGADPSPIEKAERQRESERRKEEAAGAKERQRREQAIAKAQAALEKAERKHDIKASAIEGRSLEL
jgi:colicin import membrane protein